MSLVSPNSPQMVQPVALVTQGWNKFSALAVDSFNTASSLVGQLAAYNPNPVQFDTSFDVPSNLLDGFRAPEQPEAPDFVFTPFIAAPLQLNVPEIPDFGDAPEFDAERPNLDLSGLPSIRELGELPRRPELADVVIPEAPELRFPELDPLIALTIPQKPGITEHQFQGQRPNISISEPDGFINFSEESYQSECLDRIRTELKQMLDNGTGMPAVVEQMLVDRAFARENREGIRAEQEAADRWASKGFSLPSGIVNKDIEAARQNSQNQHSTLSREVFVQRRQEEIENYRFAIAQCIALENILIQAHLNSMQRLFDFAKAVSDLSFRRVETEIAKANLELQQFVTDAQVFRSLLEAEAQKLEQFRLEIQAEALKGEINKDKIAVYTAQLESLRTIVGIFTAEVDGAKTVAEANFANARAYASEIEGVRAVVDLNNAEFGAWATKVQGQLGKVQMYSAETQAFLAKVQGYEAGARAKEIKPRLELGVEEARVRNELAILEGVRTNIQGETARMQAEASAFTSKAGMYEASGRIAAEQTAANTRSFAALVEARRAVSERAFAEANLDVEQTLRSGQQLVQALEGAARVAAQLSAGFASAVNLTASTSAQGSVSLSEQQQTIYQGEIPISGGS